MSNSKKREKVQGMYWGDGEKKRTIAAVKPTIVCVNGYFLI